MQKQVDALLSDIRDAGVRFHTYIPSPEAVIGAAIELDKPLLIPERPNPDAHYVDENFKAIRKKYLLYEYQIRVAGAEE